MHVFLCFLTSEQEITRFVVSEPYDNFSVTFDILSQTFHRLVRTLWTRLTKRDLWLRTVFLADLTFLKNE